MATNNQNQNQNQNLETNLQISSQTTDSNLQNLQNEKKEKNDENEKVKKSKHIYPHRKIFFPNELPQLYWSDWFRYTMEYILKINIALRGMFNLIILDSFCGVLFLNFENIFLLYFFVIIIFFPVLLRLI
jgi:hypothetical protein